MSSQKEQKAEPGKTEVTGHRSRSGQKVPLVTEPREQGPWSVEPPPLQVPLRVLAQHLMPAPLGQIAVSSSSTCKRRVGFPEEKAQEWRVCRNFLGQERSQVSRPRGVSNVRKTGNQQELQTSGGRVGR